MQELVIQTFFYLTDLNIEIESILEIWMMDWIFYEHDSFFTNIDYESRIWFGIDGYDSCLMNVDYDMRAWFVIWDDLYSIDISCSRAR